MAPDNVGPVHPRPRPSAAPNATTHAHDHANGRRTPDTSSPLPTTRAASSSPLRDRDRVDRSTTVPTNTNTNANTTTTANTATDNTDAAAAAAAADSSSPPANAAATAFASQQQVLSSSPTADLNDSLTAATASSTLDAAESSDTDADSSDSDSAFDLSASPGASAADLQRIDLNVSIRCPHCPDDAVPNIIEDFKQGDLICGSCGTVFKDRIIDTRSEWRTFASDDGSEDPSRVGHADNSLLNQSNQLETSIGYKDGRRGIARDLQKTHLRTTSHCNRALLLGFKDISTLGDRLGLQRNVVEAAKQYFKITVERQLSLKGRTDVMAAVCLLLGCRKTGNGRTLKEFAELVSTSKHDFGKAFMAINRAIANLTNVNGEDISARFCNALGLSHTVVAAAVSVCASARKIHEMASRTPATIAGASIYLVSNLLNEPRSAREIAALVKLTEDTVKKGFRILAANLDKILTGELANIPRSRIAGL